ncbi:MAG TPA: hypothetical protein VE715_05440 [Blastocatellia bacterium]|nr:hypothetical protein [Blastocatellia bacterium]
MFCRDFEKMAGDLAAGRSMEAGKRERALRHASECSACAPRLNAERTLEAGLRALGESVEDREAPPHLKTTLRAAFDRQVKAVPVLASTPARSRNSALRWLAAAALILIAVAVALLFRTAPSNSKEETSSGGNPARREQSPQRVNEPDNQKRKIEPYVARKTSTERRTHRRAAAFDDMARNNETVTDYIPLTYLADATAVESGTVLRVELPPSALVTMGLPAPVGRTDSRVKADVVVGDDGVPRAVRFVGQDSVRR